MGLSSRQIARLLAIILPAALGPAPATVRHWVHQEALKAGRLLKRLDSVSRALVMVACLDEIFFRRQPVLVAVEPQSMVRTDNASLSPKRVSSATASLPPECPREPPAAA
jgi:hypothetical protein